MVSCRVVSPTAESRGGYLRGRRDQSPAALQPVCRQLLIWRCLAQECRAGAIPLRNQGSASQYARMSCRQGPPRYSLQPAAASTTTMCPKHASPTPTLLTSSSAPALASALLPPVLTSPHDTCGPSCLLLWAFLPLVPRHLAPQCQRSSPRRCPHAQACGCAACPGGGSRHRAGEAAQGSCTAAPHVVDTPQLQPGAAASGSTSGHSCQLTPSQGQHAASDDGGPIVSHGAAGQASQHLAADQPLLLRKPLPTSTFLTHQMLQPALMVLATAQCLDAAPHPYCKHRDIEAGTRRGLWVNTHSTPYT